MFSKKTILIKKRKRSKNNSISGSDSDSDSSTRTKLSFGFGHEADSNKVFHIDNHIYFTADVAVKSINELCKIIKDHHDNFNSLTNISNIANITPKPIYLHINSNGGDLLEGFRAVDMIRNSTIPIYTIAEGSAVSAASIMYLAGQKKFMTVNSHLLIHQLSSCSGYQNFEQIKDNFKNDENFMNRLYDFYCNASNGKLNKKKIIDAMKHDLYWNYDVCKKYNLVDDYYDNTTENKYKIY